MKSMRTKAPIWKRNPPCTAHKILEKMFKEGKITPDTSPKDVHSLEEEFLKYSAPVFRGVFNELRQSYAIGCKLEQSHFIVHIHIYF
jgi:hypothetical protein